jgi:CBS domain-containing protein
MRIEEVMTRDVITVGPTTPIHRAAQLMVKHGVSGLPVIDDDGRLVGIVSEGDLILRQKRRSERPWWRRFFTDGEQLAREYRRALGTTVGDVMNSPVVSISPVWGIEMAATILHNKGIRRLPVVLDGQIVGIVTRADLIKALAMGGSRRPTCGAPRADSKPDQPPSSGV